MFSSPTLAVSLSGQYAPYYLKYELVCIHEARRRRVEGCRQSANTSCSQKQGRPKAPGGTGGARGGPSVLLLSTGRPCGLNGEGLGEPQAHILHW